MMCESGEIKTGPFSVGIGRYLPNLSMDDRLRADATIAATGQPEPKCDRSGKVCLLLWLGGEVFNGYMEQETGLEPASPGDG